MESFDSIYSWIEKFGIYAGLIIILLIIVASMLLYTYPEEIKNFLREHFLKIIVVIVILCIIIGIFWIVDLTRKYPASEKFRVVISPFQNIGSSENLGTYDIGAAESIKSELQKNDKMEIIVLREEEVVPTFENAKKIADKYNADIVIFGKSRDAFSGMEKSIECSIYISEKIKNKFLIQSISKINNTISATILTPTDIFLFKGQLKDGVNLIFSLEKYFSGNYEEALFFISNVSEDAMNSDTYVYKGYSQLNLNLINESLSSYNKSLTLNPHNAYALNDIGLLLQKQGKYEESLDYFNKSIAVNPDYPIVWNNKGNSLLKLGVFNDAENCYLKPLEKNPDDYLSLNNMGQLKIITNNLTEAENYLDLATNVNPKSELAWINKGALYAIKGDWKSSIDSLDKAVAINPNYADLWLTRGEILEKIGEPNESIRSFDNAIGINPNFSQAWLRKGMVYYNLNKFKDATPLFIKSLDIDPSNYDAQVMLGIAYGQEKKYDLAEAAFVKAIKIDPKQASARDNLVYLFKVSGKKYGYEVRIPLENDTLIIRYENTSNN